MTGEKRAWAVDKKFDPLADWQEVGLFLLKLEAETWASEIGGAVRVQPIVYYRPDVRTGEAGASGPEVTDSGNPTGENGTATRTPTKSEGES